MSCDGDVTDDGGDGGGGDDCDCGCDGVQIWNADVDWAQDQASSQDIPHCYLSTAAEACMPGNGDPGTDMPS